MSFDWRYGRQKEISWKEGGRAQFQNQLKQKGNEVTHRESMTNSAQIFRNRL